MSSFERRIRVFTECLGKCHYCKIDMIFGIPNSVKRKFTIDHKKPRKKNGKSNPENLVGACLSCNSVKGHLDYDEFNDLYSQQELRLRHDMNSKAWRQQMSARQGEN